MLYDLDRVRRRSPLCTIKWLINEPGIVLLIIDNRERRIGIAKLIDLSVICRTDREPVKIGIRTDPLAFVEVSFDSRTEHITAKVIGQLPVDVDVVAVGFHAFHICHIGVFGRVALCCVCPIG